MGEVDRGALIEGFRAGTNASVFGHGEVEDDLLVSGPIAAVCEDEDGIDVDVGEVAGARVFKFFVRQLPEGSGVLVVLDDVAGGRDVLEAVSLRDLPALLSLAADDQDSLVFLRHFPHWRVAADELAGGDLHVELPTQIQTSFLLRLASTVGHEDVRPSCQEIVSIVLRHSRGRKTGYTGHRRLVS